MFLFFNNLIIQVNPVLSNLVLLSIGIIFIGVILKILKQPYIVAYIIVGIIMGPHVFKITTNETLITNMGNFGLILLLFFIDMEISLPKLIANWKISTIGTFIQVLFSILVVWIVGHTLGWTINRIIMLGFVISLSSTAVVIKLLQERKEVNTKVGQNVIGILLAQDIIIVPMMIVLSYLSGESPKAIDIVKQLLGGLFIIGIIYWVLKKKEIKLPFEKQINKDHEIQVFIALAICFGFSILSSFFELSTALGAFVAGIFVSSLKQQNGFMKAYIHLE